MGDPIASKVRGLQGYRNIVSTLAQLIREKPQDEHTSIATAWIPSSWELDWRTKVHDREHCEGAYKLTHAQISRYLQADLPIHDEFNIIFTGIFLYPPRVNLGCMVRLIAERV